jgi:hypothetical protein
VFQPLSGVFGAAVMLFLWDHKPFDVAIICLLAQDIIRGYNWCNMALEEPPISANDVSWMKPSNGWLV